MSETKTQRYVRDITTPACPRCGSPLEEVEQKSPKMLNDDQFNSVKCGAWFCRTCPPDTGRKFAYWWNRDVILPDRRKRTRRTVEPVGIGGAPDEALRLREALEPFARLLGEIESGDPAITHYDDGYLFAVYDANGMLGELSAADLRCAARALAREATNQGGQDAEG